MTVNSATTNGIKITVRTEFQMESSKPDLGRHIHTYLVIIENYSGLEVQLLSREWIISDSNGEERVVSGAGVVGEQPIIAPEQSYSYSSWCPLKTPIGMMKGKYIMKRTADGSLFEAIIPPFKLIADFVKN